MFVCSYLSVLQIALNILDQQPHSLLQTPEQLLLPIKYFISYLQTEEKIKCCLSSTTPIVLLYIYL